MCSSGDTDFWADSESSDTEQDSTDEDLKDVSSSSFIFNKSCYHLKRCTRDVMVVLFCIRVGVLHVCLL